MKERRKYPTVLRYPGGKSRIVYYLFRKEMIPEEIKEYREGFLGGGSCALAFSTMYPDVPVWVNDLYYNLYIFWMQLRDNCDTLTNRILELKDEACRAGDVDELERKHRELYDEMRTMVDTSTDHLDIATSFYILNRSSFGGFTEQGKNSFIRDSYKNTIFSQSKIKKLPDISKIIQNWKITNTDYRESDGELLVRMFLCSWILLTRSKTCSMVRTKKCTLVSHMRTFIEACKEV